MKAALGVLAGITGCGGMERSGTRWRMGWVAGWMVAAFLVAGAAHGQKRSEGLSLHLLPKRVAEVGGMPWGLE